MYPIGNFKNHESADIIHTTTAISTDRDPNIIGMKDNEAYCPVPQSHAIGTQRNDAYGTIDLLTSNVCVWLQWLLNECTNTTIAMRVIGLKALSICVCPKIKVQKGFVILFHY